MAATVVAEKVIRVDVVTSAAAQRNIKLLADEVSRVEKNTDKMKTSLEAGFGNISKLTSNLTGALATLGIGTTFATLAKQVLDAASAYQVLEARMKIVLGTEEAAVKATSQVIAIAVQTGREVDGVAKLYEKAARSAQQFGISQEDVRKITLGFAESIRLSGSSTQEAYASLVQFGQALASGRLQGDEFRSLMENNSVFMYEFAAAAGVSVAQLRKMGTEGKLNAQFLFETMLKKGADGLTMLERLEEKAKQMPLTFAQSLNSLKTQTTEMVGELAKALSLKSDDPLGMFGPLIRSLKALTEEIKRAKTESDALGESSFGRLMRLLGVGDRSALGDIADVLPGVGLLNRLRKRLTQGEPGSQAGEIGSLTRLRREASNAQSELSNVDNEIAKIEQTPESRRTSDQSSRLGYLTTKAQELQKLIAGAKAEIETLENFDGTVVSRNFKEPKPKFPTGPTEEELKRLKAAQKSFEEYVQGLRQARDAELALAAGKAESLKNAKEEQEVLQKAKEAGFAATSAKVKEALLLTKETAQLKENREEREKIAKFAQDQLEKESKANEKIEESIMRDQGAIDALKNKTKATQEYTSAVMAKQLADSLAARFVTPDEDPYAAILDNRIKLLNEAIDKRNELEYAQATSRFDKERQQIDAQRERDILQMSDSIVQSLTSGLDTKGADIGTQLWENIQNTFRKKVIDIVFNPILDPIAQALARLATKFAEDIAINIALSTSSTGALSLLAKLIGTADPSIGPPAPTKAVGMDYVPYDGFMASLHRGERVQTAKEAQDYRDSRARGWSGGQLSLNPVYQISIDSRTDSETIAANTQEAVAMGNRQLIEQLRSEGLLP